tara:strand:+ start:223 stop:765 length:543 start_codon:yes stop_codon:yes gene_type:complete
MNYYETLYIVHPALESGRLKDIIISIQSMIESKDIKVLCTDYWGKKKLAYLIDKQQYGSYVLVQLQSSGDNINKINAELEHNADVLSYLTSRIDESNLIKDSRSLDDQILGSKSSESDKKSNEPVKVESSESASKDDPNDSDGKEESSESASKEASTEKDSETDNDNEELTSEDKDGSDQ